MQANIGARWFPALSVIIVLTLVAGGAALAGSGQNSGSRGGATLSFRELTCNADGAHCHTANVGSATTSMGDTLTFNLPLKQGGVPIGRSLGQCVTLNTGATGMLCRGVFRLADGDITTSGRVPLSFSTAGTYAVDGGTGLYDGAGGTVTQQGTSVTIDLLP